MSQCHILAIDNFTKTWVSTVMSADNVPGLINYPLMAGDTINNYLLLGCNRLNAFCFQKRLSHTNVSLTIDQVNNLIRLLPWKSHHGTRLEFINHNFLNPARLKISILQLPILTQRLKVESIDESCFQGLHNFL